MPMTRARRDTGTAHPVYLPREGLDVVPIFHAFGRYRQLHDGSETRTRCGRVIRRFRNGTGETVRVTHLRLDHAEAFAEPCSRCWPPLGMTPPCSR